jgi:hypothetical protein
MYLYFYFSFSIPLFLSLNFSSINCNSSFSFFFSSSNLVLVSLYSYSILFLWACILPISCMISLNYISKLSFSSIYGPKKLDAVLEISFKSLYPNVLQSKSYYRYNALSYTSYVFIKFYSDLCFSCIYVAFNSSFISFPSYSNSFL